MKNATLILLTSIFLFATGCTAMPLEQVVKPSELNPEKWSAARCNDGSPFAYNLKTNPDSDVWLIYLEGGGYCNDGDESCAERQNKKPELTRSEGQDLAMAKNGIFINDSELNPHFHNANKVHAHYCSSDLWTGSSTETQAIANGDQWYFSGHHNVKALLQSLKEFGLKDGEAQILFAGSSAGCFGVMQNAHQMVEEFPRSAENDAIKLISDACYLPSTPNNLLDQIKIGMELWNSQTLPGCTGADCFASEVAHSIITSCTEGLCLENLIQSSSIDPTIRRAAAEKNEETWRKMLLKELNQYDWLFSGGDKAYHILLKSKLMWNYKADNGRSFGDLVNHYWEEKMPKQILFGNP